MKNITKLFFAAAFLTAGMASAQSGVGVGTTTPNASAALDVTSTTKGFLMPRMTTVQRTAITTPAAGLQVYDTDTNSTWLYNGTVWVASATGTQDLRMLTNNNHLTADAGTGSNGSSLGTGADNIAIGKNAMSSNTSGVQNYAIGTDALSSNTTGSNNVALGQKSQYLNTTGSTNVSFGNATLQDNTTGNYNTAIGTLTLFKSTTASFNSGIGFAALQNNTTGHSNSAVGNAALINNTTGHSNSVLGFGTLRNNTIGAYNVAIGYEAGKTLTSGDNNIFIGNNASPNISISSSNQLNIGNWIYAYNGNVGIGSLNPTSKLDVNGYVKLASSDTTGDTAPLAGMIRYNGGLQYHDGSTWNTVGSAAQDLRMLTNNNHLTADAGTGSNGSSLGTGADNIAIGKNAMSSNTSGVQNYAIGTDALSSNTTGSNNVALGQKSQYLNTTGSTNVSIGNATLQDNTTGNYNTAIGTLSLFKNTTASFNSGIGFAALQNNTNGHSNSAVGNAAMLNNTSGHSNSVLGFGTLRNNTIGAFNVAIGYEAGKNNIDGSYNTVIGYNAGSTLTGGQNNIFIGNNVAPNISNTASNQLNIGNWIYGHDGKIGIGITSPNAKLHINDSSTASLQRSFQIDGADNQFITWISKVGNGNFNSIVQSGDQVLLFSTDSDSNANDLNGLVIAPHNDTTNAGIKIMDGGSVGVGVANPTEKLEVAGAIKIGNTTTATPTAGTIRFNTTTNKFEGYDGTAWVAFH